MRNMSKMKLTISGANLRESGVSQSTLPWITPLSPRTLSRKFAPEMEKFHFRQSMQYSYLLYKILLLYGIVNA